MSESKPTASEPKEGIRHKRARPEPIRLADALLFGPLGVAMKLRADLPEAVEAVERIRDRAAAQVRTANTIGKFVTPVLRRKLAKLVTEQVAIRTQPKDHRTPQLQPRPAATRPAATSADSRRVSSSSAPKTSPGVAKATTVPKAASEVKTNAVRKGASRAKPTTVPKGATRTDRAVPTANTLGIDGYDGLPSSAVVPLLDGLTVRQLQAVLAYEQANRARRTVLHRTSQLLER